MEANKIILNGKTLIDLTSDTALEEDVIDGKIFHKPDGSVGTGRAVRALEKQEKAISIIENGTTEVLPDEGFTLSKVTINTNVESEKVEQPSLFPPIITSYINSISWKNDTQNGGFIVVITGTIDGVEVTSPLKITEDMNGKTLVITATSPNFAVWTQSIDLEYLNLGTSKFTARFPSGHTPERVGFGASNGNKGTVVFDPVSVSAQLEQISDTTFYVETNECILRCVESGNIDSSSVGQGMSFGSFATYQLGLSNTLTVNSLVVYDVTDDVLLRSTTFSTYGGSVSMNLYVYRGTVPGFTAGHDYTITAEIEFALAES